MVNGPGAGALAAFCLIAIFHSSGFFHCIMQEHSSLKTTCLPSGWHDDSHSLMPTNNQPTQSCHPLQQSGTTRCVFTFYMLKTSGREVLGDNPVCLGWLSGCGVCNVLKHKSVSHKGKVKLSFDGWQAHSHFTVSYCWILLSDMVFYGHFLLVLCVKFLLLPGWRECVSVTLTLCLLVSSRRCVSLYVCPWMTDLWIRCCKHCPGNVV